MRHQLKKLVDRVCPVRGRKVAEVRRAVLIIPSSKDSKDKKKMIALEEDLYDDLEEMEEFDDDDWDVDVLSTKMNNARTASTITS